MNNRNLIAAFVVATAASPCLAQSFTGGEVTLGYSAFTGNANDLNATNLKGSAEVDFNRSFALQGDLAYSTFGLSNFDATNVTLHAIYHINQTSSAGAFVGNESIEGESSTFFGVEAGANFETLGVEIYYAKPTDNIIDTASIYGLIGNVAINDAFSVNGRFDRITADIDGGVSRYAIGADYKITPTFKLYAETGNATITSSGSNVGQTFFGLGGTYTFGGERGATFANRGLAQLVPGL